MSNWLSHIKKLEEFDWSGLEPGFRVNECETVTDPGKFVGSHLGMIRANAGTRVGRSYIRRLWGVYKRLKFKEMSARLQPKLQAKKMVNAIYQPMGVLMCHVSQDEKWAWAKNRTREQLDLLMSEIPMYTGNINPNWKYWNNVLEALQELP